MTNLREEIVELITKEAPPEEFVKLSRSWALDCVGEDLPDPKCSGIQAWFYQNETKQEIRKKIEEELEK